MLLRLLFRAVLFLPMLWLGGLCLYIYGVWHVEPYTGDAEGIVVLTGGEGRVEAGLKLLAGDHAKRLLISGVHHDVKIAELLELNHQDKKLADRIDLGFNAQDTLGNADEAAAWVARHHIESLIVVTAHYHMPRAMLHLGAQLPAVALYPYPVRTQMFQGANWYKNPGAVHIVVGDYNKFLATWPQILFFKQI